MSIPLIKNMNINGSAIQGNMSIPLIISQDVGKYAAERLNKLDFSGFEIVNLYGVMQDFNQATSILGKAIGKPELPYIQFPYADAENAMIGMGLKPKMAALYAEMCKGANEGLLKPDPQGSNQTTLTTLEEFSLFFAAAYQA